MGRHHSVYGSHTYAERHFVHIGIQRFLVLKTCHHRLVFSVEGSTHTPDQFIIFSDLGVFQHSYASKKQNEGNDAYFPIFR